MGGKRKYILKDSDVEYLEEGIEKRYFVYSLKNKLATYMKFHDSFLTVIPPDLFTLREAREIKLKNPDSEIEILKECKIKRGY